MESVYCVGMGCVTSPADDCSELLNNFLYHNPSLSETYNDAQNKGIKKIRSLTGHYKYSAIAKRVLNEALEDAGIKLENMTSKRIGLVVGTSLGNLTFFEQHVNDGIRGIAENTEAANCFMHNICYELVETLKLTGPSFTISNTCVSGIAAVSVAHSLIMSNIIDTCIVFGIEIISDLIFYGLDSLNVLSKKDTLQPFSKDRDGMILGEAAGCLILSNGSNHKNRYARIAGYSITNDTTHLTRPDTNGRGLHLAIDESLKMAKCNPNEIDVVFCGANGTVYNDAMYAKVIDDLWGQSETLVTSIKPLIGHTLGAAGILETIGALIMMKNDFIAPIGRTYKLDDSIKNFTLVHKIIHKQTKTAIVTCSGFSGSNGGVILERTIK